MIAKIPTKAIVGCFLLWSTLHATHSMAQAVHALIAGDTNDPALSSGVKSNIVRFEKLISEIASTTGRTLNLKTIRDGEFNCNNIVSALNVLQGKQDDLVFFYYAGHGFRLAGQPSRFPRLWCGATSAAGTPLLEEVTMALWAKATTPRFVWSWADACNAEAPPPPPAVAADNSAKERRIEAIRRLFGQHTGTLLMAGADTGQYSFYLPDGGQFSKQMIEALEDEFDRGSQANWDRVLSAGTKPFQTRYQGRVYLQQPIQTSTLRFVNSK